MKIEPLTLEGVLPWWLRDGVRPVPPNPLRIPGLDGSPVPIRQAIPAAPEAVAFDRAAFAAALIRAGHAKGHAVTTAGRAAQVFGLVPLAEALAKAPEKHHPALAALTPDSRKKALQAANMALGWLKGEAVRPPKAATGGRKATNAAVGSPS